MLFVEAKVDLALKNIEYSIVLVTLHPTVDTLLWISTVLNSSLVFKIILIVLKYI